MDNMQIIPYRFTCGRDGHTNHLRQLAAWSNYGRSHGIGRLSQSRGFSAYYFFVESDSRRHYHRRLIKVFARERVRLILTLIR